MLSQGELARKVVKIGEEKVNRKNRIVFLSAILAGLFIGLGYFGFYSVTQNDTSAAAGFLGGTVFSVGLVMLLIAGGDLFTGNCLITVGYFDKKYKTTSVIKNLTLVFLGNFVGALILVALLYFSGMYKNIVIVMEKSLMMKTSLNFVEALLRGVLCNIIVSVAVYISYASKSIGGKIAAAMLPVILFVVSGFEHSVANMFFLFMGKAAGYDISLIDIFVTNLLPVTIGNIIGGAILVPGAYYILYLKGRKEDN